MSAYSTTGWSLAYLTAMEIVQEIVAIHEPVEAGGLCHQDKLLQKQGQTVHTIKAIP